MLTDDPRGITPKYKLYGVLLLTVTAKVQIVYSRTGFVSYPRLYNRNGKSEVSMRDIG